MGRVKNTGLARKTHTAKKGREVRKRRSTCKIKPENRPYPEWDNDLFMANGRKHWTDEQCAYLWARRLVNDTYKEIQKTMLRTEIALRLKCHHMVRIAKKAGMKGRMPIVGPKPKKGQLWIDETPAAAAPVAEEDDDAMSSASTVSAGTPEPETETAPVATLAPEAATAPAATPVPDAATAPPPSAASVDDALLTVSAVQGMHAAEEDRLAARRLSRFRCAIGYLLN